MNPKTMSIQCPGYSIAADWYDGTTDEVMLVLPGYSSNKSNNAQMTQAIGEGTGTSALVIDYAGHGESPFDLPEVSPAQNFLDVIHAFDWLKDNKPELKINVLGTSYGGYLATQLTKYREFEKLIIRVPAIYPPNVFYTKWKDIDREWINDEYRKNTEILKTHPLLALASQFKGKTFIIVHGADALVPKATTDAYIEAFGADSWVAEWYTHGFRGMNLTQEEYDKYFAIIIEWMKS